LNCWIDSQIV